MKKILEHLKENWIKYGFETFVIVVGILGAFSLNNWNEEQKRQDKIKGIYAKIKNDLKVDIEKIDAQIHSILRKDSIFKKVIEKEMTVGDYEKCSDCFQLLNGFEDLILETSGIELLSENSTLVKSQEDSLFIDVGKFYSYHDTRIRDMQGVMSADFLDNWFYLKNNMPWFSDYINSLKTDEILDYMVNSPDYRNRVSAVYLFQYEVFLNHIKSFKKDALIIIEDIDKRIQ